MGEPEAGACERGSAVHRPLEQAAAGVLVVPVREDEWQGRRDQVRALEGVRVRLVVSPST